MHRTLMPGGCNLVEADLKLPPESCEFLVVFYDSGSC